MTQLLRMTFLGFFREDEGSTPALQPRTQTCRADHLITGSPACFDRPSPSSGSWRTNTINKLNPFIIDNYVEQNAWPRWEIPYSLGSTFLSNLDLQNILSTCYHFLEGLSIFIRTSCEISQECVLNLERISSFKRMSKWGRQACR